MTFAMPWSGSSGAGGRPPLAYSFLVSELTYEVSAGTVRAAGTLIYDYTPK